MAYLEITGIIITVIGAGFGGLVALRKFVQEPIREQYVHLKESYERQIRFLESNYETVKQQRDRAEDRCQQCEQELEACRERLRRATEGFQP